MNTMQSRPNSAAAVAVATPCWPAPVSAIRRFLPMRRVRSACPRTLLILCERVWVRAARLRTTRPPRRSERRRHSVTGVGRPAYDCKSPANSRRNASNPHAPRNSRSSSSSAGTRLSGTNRPPNPSPKRPSAAGSGPGGSRCTASPRASEVTGSSRVAGLVLGPVVRSVGAAVRPRRVHRHGGRQLGGELLPRFPRLFDEPSELARILAAGRGLDAARHLDTPGADAAYRLTHLLRG